MSIQARGISCRIRQQKVARLQTIWWPASHTHTVHMHGIHVFACTYLCNACGCVALIVFASHRQRVGSVARWGRGGGVESAAPGGGGCGAGRSPRGRGDGDEGPVAGLRAGVQAVWETHAESSVAFAAKCGAMPEDRAVIGHRVGCLHAETGSQFRSSRPFRKSRSC